MSRRTTPHVSEGVATFQAVRSAQLASATVVNDASLLGRFIRQTGDPALHLLTRAMVEDFFVTICDQQPASWNKIRSRLGTFFDFCTRRGWISMDLLTDIRPKRVVRKERLRLSQDQLIRLLDVADPRDRAVIALAENTALRASTITALTVGDVDLAYPRSVVISMRIWRVSLTSHDSPTLVDVGERLVALETWRRKRW